MKFHEDNLKDFQVIERTDKVPRGITKKVERLTVLVLCMSSNVD